ncbi:MAG: polysaccharide deacetylase family protein, partial [Armatimonadetes bacterium]|nr:polysaccharide deacetylase family protein [Armatimonadota bacterium]
RHREAVKPLKDALTRDRNDALAAMTLATLYLHCGSPDRAATEFARARRIAPGDELATRGAILAELAAGRVAKASALVKGTDAPIIGDYVRFLSGDVASLVPKYAAVNADESDALRLELAAFVAERTKNTSRAKSLFAALLDRADRKRLQEDTALVFLFDDAQPAQGCAAKLASAIGFAEAKPNAAPLSGRVTLVPPKEVAPRTIGYVAYSVDGGVYSASTNFAPFVCDWNTVRIPNGDYTLRTQVFDGNQRLVKETARTVTVRNAQSAAATSLLSPGERADLRRRLAVLLAPRPSNKSAHFALAGYAARDGDSETALSHIESVVAIDPGFGNARASLKTFNRQMAGPCEGVWKGETTEKIVALTFDDGPNSAPHRTPALLTALKEVGATATFFVVGKMVEKSPDLVTRMFDDGHEIANHSYSHPNLTYLTPLAVQAELCRTSVLVRDLTGSRPRFYRPPGGNFNTATVDAARSLGLAGAYWTLDAIRLETAPLPPAELTKYVLQNVRPGSIVLLHNAPENTVAAVGNIVRGLRERGYKLVTMTELLKRSKPVLKGAATPKRANMFDGGE